MTIIYSEHLVERLKERKFPKDYPKIIFKNASTHYYDNVQNSYVAIKKMSYGGKLKNIAVVYTYIGSDVKIITIHPEKDSEINNRIKKGRYHEKYDKKI